MIAPQTVSTSRHFPSVVRPGAGRQRALVVARAGTAEGVVDDVANGIANVAQSSAAQLKQALAAAEKASGVAADAYGKVSPAIEKATKAVSPIVNDAVEASKPLASSLATEVTKASSSAASSVVSGATAALKDAGVSPTAIKSVESAATGAYSTAKPVVTSFLDFVTTTDPITLVEYSAAAAAFVLAFPSIASFVARALRGYAGATSPAIVLDRLSTGSSVALVDIRSQQSKEAEGIPDLRDKSKYIQLEAAVVDDGRVRRELKNIGSLEVTMTAMQVAALKKISKKTELYIMVGIDLDPDLDRLSLSLWLSLALRASFALQDKNGSLASAVAKEVAAKGFSRTFVVKGGFAGWKRERLPIRMAESVGRVEVVAPSAVLFGSTKKAIGEGSTAKKSLPAPKVKALPPGM